jgi:zinc transport system substrate-binding protein
MRLTRAVATLAVLVIGLGLPVQAGMGAQPKIKIVASIFPLQEFARAVAGEHGDTTLLLPPGAGVHTWQPRASDIIRLSTTDLFIYIGAGLEPWIADVLKSLPPSRPRILAVMDSLPLSRPETREHEEDPHIWLDLGIDREIVGLLARTLGEIDPAKAAAFADNASRYSEELRRIEEKYSAVLGGCRQKTFLLGGHAAFGYLAAKFGLEQKAVSGLSPDAEPTPGRLMEAIQWAKTNGIRTVFREANANDQMARLLAKEIGAGILVLHPGANLSKREWTSGITFLDIMLSNLDNLKRGLGCD